MSDPMGMFAQPFEVIDRRRVDPVARVADLVASYEVSQVVVGLPVQLDGRRGLAVAATEAFVELLRPRLDALNIPVAWWDERLSTAAAQRVMLADGVRRDRRKQTIDKVAAALILQSYLDAQRP